MKKIFITLVFLFANQANAMVNFNIENSPFISHLKVEDNLMLIQDKKQDFIILYNNKNEMLYIKHKKLDKTFKIAVSKIRESKFLTNLKPENAEITILNFKSQLFSLIFGGRECLQLYGTQNLELNSGADSMFNLYKGFVYFTGQNDLPQNCRNMYFANSFSKKTGFPLAVFYKGKQIKLSNMINSKITMAKFLKQNNLTPRKAKKPDLNLQYEMMFSLLSENQQQTFLAQSKDKPINIKIRAIENLLANF